MTELMTRYEWPTVYDWKVRTGDTKRFRVSLDDNEGVLDDLDFTTGYTFLAEVAANNGPDSQHVAVIEVTAVAPKTLECLLTEEQSGNLRTLLNRRGKAKAQWDLQVTQLDPPHTQTLFAGDVAITGDVARED